MSSENEERAIIHRTTCVLDFGKGRDKGMNDSCTHVEFKYYFC